MEVWAEAIHSLNTADENTDLALVLKVVNGNNTIPVVVIDAKDSVQAIRNINFTATKSADVNSQALALAHQLKRKGSAIKLQMSDNPHDFIESVLRRFAPNKASNHLSLHTTYRCGALHYTGTFSPFME